MQPKTFTPFRCCPFCLSPFFSKHVLLLFISLYFFLPTLKAQVIYNAYARVTTVTSSTLLAVSNVNETNHTFAAGEQVVVMQMQDDVIGTNTANTSSFGNLGSISNAGIYEIATILAVNRSAGTATSISVTTPLANTYNTGANSRVQVISFRLLNASAYTTSANITGVAWNGTIGGVIALRVGGDLTLNHAINANGLGFRGGTVSVNYYGGGTTCSTIAPASSSNQNGGKGEGIYAVTSATQAYGTAKVLNGGGGGGQDINGGGGGGGNYTAGGLGGIGWSCTSLNNASGQGGITLSVSISSNRVFMGGGGGGGQQNNSNATVGGAGGGIILIKANRLLTAGCASSPTITARGNNSSNSGNDGAGGAGAGGSVVLEIPTYSVNAGCPLRVDAGGGRGGSVTDASQHAGGGAGGQGVVVYSIPQPTLNIVTATSNGTPGCNNAGCTSSAGVAGGTNNAGIVTLSSVVLPIQLVSFTGENTNIGSKLQWSTASQKNTAHFLIERSSDGITWTTVDKQDAAGTQHGTKSYTAWDYNPPAGLVYYRLVAVDFDQSRQNSPVLVLEVQKETAELVLYPNPATKEVMLALSTDAKITAVQIFDGLGKAMEVLPLQSLDVNVRLDISDLQKGIYYVKVQTSGKLHTHKLVVE